MHGDPKSAPASIDAIVFDLDGTLVDSAPAVSGVLNAMRADKGMVPAAIDRYRNWISLGASELVQRSLEIDQSFVTDGLAEFRERYQQTPTPADCLYPAVPETLAALRRQGSRLAICSNKPSSLCRKIIDELGLSPFFDVIVGAEPGLRAKPDPEPLVRALTGIGVDSRAIFVGDSTIDQLTADAGAIPFVFFSSGYDDGVARDRAFMVIKRIDEILELFP